MVIYLKKIIGMAWYGKTEISNLFPTSAKKKNLFPTGQPAVVNVISFYK